MTKRLRSDAALLCHDVCGSDDFHWWQEQKTEQAGCRKKENSPNKVSSVSLSHSHSLSAVSIFATSGLISGYQLGRHTKNMPVGEGNQDQDTRAAVPAKNFDKTEFRCIEILNKNMSKFVDIPL